MRAMAQAVRAILKTNAGGYTYLTAPQDRDGNRQKRAPFAWLPARPCRICGCGQHHLGSNTVFWAGTSTQRRAPSAWLPARPCRRRGYGRHRLGSAPLRYLAWMMRHASASAARYARGSQGIHSCHCRSADLRRKSGLTCRKGRFDEGQSQGIHSCHCLCADLRRK